MGGNMERNKATFRAMREIVGITQAQMAKLMQVQDRSVRRWEHPKETRNNPPAEAWEIILNAYRVQTIQVQAIRRAHEESGEPIHYYSTAEAYEKADPGHGEEFTRYNASARRAHVEMANAGIVVPFVYVD